MEISRREAFKSLGGLASSLCIDLIPNKHHPQPTPDKEWNLLEHFQEWMLSPDYVFPWDKRVLDFNERLTFPPLYSSRDDNSRAQISLGTVITTDLRLDFGHSPSNLKWNQTLYNVNGNAHFVLNLNNLGPTVYYRISYKLKTGWKPISPVRAFINPLREEPLVVYLLSDPHIYADNFVEAHPLQKDSSVQNGLQADYAFYFLKNALLNPEWYINIDKKNKENINWLNRTFHYANAISCIIKENKLPGLIIDFGDVIGFESKNLARQGLYGCPRQKAAELSWKRYRKYNGAVTPFSEFMFISGNHDGECVFTNPYHAFYKSARIDIWNCDNFLAVNQDENYFRVQRYQGKVDFYGLDVPFHSGNFQEGCGPKKPQDYRLGKRQKARFYKDLQESRAIYKFVCMHNVVGGWDPEGTMLHCGMGPLFSAEDYYACGIDPNSVEQPELTRTAEKYGVKAFLKGHDHLAQKRVIGIGRDSNPVYAINIGATKGIASYDQIFRHDSLFQQWYGYQYHLDYFDPSEITQFTISQNEIWARVICSSIPKDSANIRSLNPKLGQTLSGYLL